jgi:hypothetical protein
MEKEERGREPEPGKKIPSGGLAKGIRLKVNFEENPGKDISVAAYAFDRGGTLLAHAPVKEGQARLDISRDQAKRARILIGPSLEGRREQTPGLPLLERLHAYEPKFVFNPEQDTYELLPIPKLSWDWWRWCRCRVRGKVVKPVTIHGVTSDMPVCHARVHICEVDPLLIIIPRLPDSIIDRLRRELVIALEHPFPWPPEPDPPPVYKFNPGVVDPSPENIAGMNRVPEEVLAAEAAVVGPAISAEYSERELSDNSLARIEGAGTRVNLNMPGQSGEMTTRSLTTPLPPATRAALMSISMPTVKQALLASVDLIRPYLCWWPWIWPYLYSCDEIAVLDTDSQGRFETDIWYPCAGDHPDLYFWVEYCIGGTWTTVYHRPIRCSTYWNYACGSEVIIRITDARVPWCGDPPSLVGKQVAIMTIGNKVSIPEIQGAAAGTNEGLTVDGRPFGGRLEPHVWFGQDDLIAAGITHYKWSYRRMDGADGWHDMDRQVVRHYAVIDPTPPFSLTFKPFVLGPDPAFPTQNLFKIQPTDPPAGSYGWAPMVDARENTASAFLLSHLLEGGDAEAAADKYELKLELFNSAGNPVNLTDQGVSLKVPTTAAPFGPGTVPTIPAPSEYQILDGAGKVIGFRMVLRIDNNPCQAFIYPTSVGGTSAGPCGFINYTPGDDAYISFKARHANDFATFNFGLYRGSAGEIIDVSGSVETSPINGFTRNAAGIYSDDVAINSLVDACPGGAAAFAETLYVYAIATDGWSILQHLDAHAVPKAFALRHGS